MTLLGTLSVEAHEIEERLRTISICIVAMTCVAYGLYVLRAVLVPLVLAIALKYLLQPLIDVLSVRPLPCCGKLLCQDRGRSHRNPTTLRRLATCVCTPRLPHGLAVCVALAVAFSVLGLLGFIVVESIHVFSQRADMYGARVEALALSCLNWFNAAQMRLTGTDSGVASTLLAQSAVNGTNRTGADSR